MFFWFSMNLCWLGGFPSDLSLTAIRYKAVKHRAVLDDYPGTMQPVNSGSRPACLHAPFPPRPPARAVGCIMTGSSQPPAWTSFWNYTPQWRKAAKQRPKKFRFRCSFSFSFFFVLLLLCYTETERRVTALWNHVRRAITHHKNPTDPKKNWKKEPSHRLEKTTEPFVSPHCDTPSNSSS